VSLSGLKSFISLSSIDCMSPKIWASLREGYVKKEGIV
jgi:hypothetical protein